MRFLAFLFILSFSFATAQQQNADVVTLDYKIEIKAIVLTPQVISTSILPVKNTKAVALRFNSLKEFNSQHLVKKRQEKVYYIKRKASSKIC